MIWLSLFVTLALGADVPELYQRSYEQEATSAFRSALSTLDALPTAEKGDYTFKVRRAWLLYLDGRIELSPSDLGAMLVQIVLDGIRKRAT